MKWVLSAVFVLLFTISSASAFHDDSPYIENPGSIMVEDVLRGGYAESNFVIRSSSSEGVPFELSPAGTLKDWISIDKTSFTSSSVDPVAIKVIVRPPKDAPSGVTEGLIVMNTQLPGNRVTSSTNKVNMIKLSVSVTDQVIEEVHIDNIHTEDAEEGSSVISMVHLWNEGNIPVNLRIVQSLLDDEGDQLSSGEITEQVVPSAEAMLSVSAPSDNLLPSTYNSEVKVFMNDELVRKSTMPFELYALGAPKKKGALDRFINARDVSPGQKLSITAYFTNTGEVPLSVYLEADVSLNDEKIDVIRGEPVEVSVGEKVELEMTYTPKAVGSYLVGGHAIYDGKKSNYELTYFNVGRADYLTLSMVPLALILFAGLSFYLHRISKNNK